MDFRITLDGMAEGAIEIMCKSDSACSLDSAGDVTGVVQKGHHAPWKVRRFAVDEGLVDSLYDAGWPLRTYMCDMPWSLLYPDEPPCDQGPETILWAKCKRTDVGAVAVTVLDLS